MALLLLVYAAADLAIPGVCQTDYLPPALDLSSTARVQALQYAGESTASGYLSNEDCFCCCSHITIAELPTIGIAIKMAGKPERSTSPTLAGFLYPPFNPPKS